jgi:hypothetical protein
MVRRPTRRLWENAVATLDHSPAGPRDHLADWRPSDLRRVVVHLCDGDTVQVGTAPNRDSALILARSVIADMQDAPGEWPMIGNRLLRPGSILSVDLVAPTPSV